MTSRQLILVSNLSQQLDEVAAVGDRAKRIYKNHFGFERSPKHYNALLLSL